MIYLYIIIVLTIWISCSLICKKEIGPINTYQDLLCVSIIFIISPFFCIALLLLHLEFIFEKLKDKITEIGNRPVFWKSRG